MRGRYSPITSDQIIRAMQGVENGGQVFALASGGTIAHGLDSVPTIINITASTSGVSDLRATADATNITLTYTASGSEDFYWEAKIR